MATSDGTADITIAARAIWQGGGSRPRTFPRGRLCDASGCETILSIYNRADSCAKHQEAKPRPPRLGRPRAAERQLWDRRFLTLSDLRKV